MNGSVYDYTQLGSQSTPPRPPAQPKRSGKIPCIGCIAIAVAAALFGGIGAAVFFGLPAIMKSNDAYREAIARASQDARVLEALGEPVEDGWMPSGNINVNGATGQANLKVSISGPKASGSLYLEAAKSTDVWRFDVLKVRVDGTGQEIDLLQP